VEAKRSVSDTPSTRGLERGGGRRVLHKKRTIAKRRGRYGRIALIGFPQKRETIVTKGKKRKPGSKGTKTNDTERHGTSPFTQK